MKNIKKIYKIHIDWNSIESIEKAEKVKAHYEGAGFKLIKTIPGFNTCTLVYEFRKTI